MALDDLDYNRISLDFFYLYLTKPRFRDIISGTSQPQITSVPLKNIEIPLPPLEDQRRIAAILDKAASIRRYRARAITKADAFLRSVFLELFGDPVSNSKRLPLTRLGDLAKVVTGNTPPRASEHLRSEEHTSELQSLMRISYAVFCLKKKTTNNQQRNENIQTTTNE